MYKFSKFNALKLALSSALVIAPLSANADKPPCSNGDQYGGQRSLVVQADVSASDIQNNAAQAWREIAEAAQETYGGMVSADGGMVSVTVQVKVYGVFNAVSGPYTIDFASNQSIGRAIMESRGLQNTYPGTFADMDCDPRKNNGNDCCDECAGLSILGPLDVFNSGFMIAGIKSTKGQERFSLIKNSKSLAA